MLIFCNCLQLLTYSRLLFCCGGSCLEEICIISWDGRDIRTLFRSWFVLLIVVTDLRLWSKLAILWLLVWLFWGCLSCCFAVIWIRWSCLWRSHLVWIPNYSRWVKYFLWWNRCLKARIHDFCNFYLELCFSVTTAGPLLWGVGPSFYRSTLSDRIRSVFTRVLIREAVGFVWIGVGVHDLHEGLVGFLF